MTSLKKDKAGLQDEIKEIRADSDRKQRRQTNQFKEAQNAEKQLEQVMTTSKLSKSRFYRLEKDMYWYLKMRVCLGKCPRNACRS